MIRTRDLVVFVAVLLFLLLGVVFTIIHDTEIGLGTLPVDLSMLSSTSPTFVAEGEKREINRDDIITRLRNALLLKETEVEPQPSVEESAGQIEGEVAQDEEKNTEVQYCSTYDDTQNVVRSWPLNGIAVVASASAREVVHAQVQQAAQSASSTATSTQTTRTLLKMPLLPIADGNEYCIPGEVVGVTTSGSLMYNKEVAFYRGYGPEYLIGYARDGFPIYGYYEGAVDACGGYVHPSGYRYSITNSRDYVLGCYSAQPSSFTGF